MPLEVVLVDIDVLVEPVFAPVPVVVFALEPHPIAAQSSATNDTPRESQDRRAIRSVLIGDASAGRSRPSGRYPDASTRVYARRFVQGARMSRLSD
jgi:hypothetical protein